MNLIPFVLISLLGGLIIPLQLSIVGAFRHDAGASQIQATFYLYLGGTITSFILALLMDGSIIPPMVKNISWWMWIPGFLGSFYILFMFVATPKIGPANTLLWVFLGQIIFSIILNHIGFLGLEERKIEPLKIIGILFIVIGAFVMIYAQSVSKP